jgi:opacity protein-like surface antigen
MIKSSVIAVILFLICIPTFSGKQPKRTEGGFFAGTSYYLGEINPTLQFYKPSISAGGLLRWVLNSRYALRGQLNYGRFSGNDLDFSNEFQRARAASFTESILDLHAVGEFNFFPFRYDPRKLNISPYVFVGIGYAFIVESSTNNSSHFNIPFGIGVKYSLLKNVNIGMEWSFRKTFTDRVDGLVNPNGGKYQSSIFNKDTYSFAGIFLTFGLFGGRRDCPVYE